MKKIVLLTLLCLLQTGMIKAQTNVASLQYSVAIPTGNLKDYVAKTSWRGLNFDYRASISDNFAAGFSAGYQLFYEKRSNATITEGTITLTGTQFRYINLVPVTVNATYYFNPGQIFSPYVGLGAGTIYRETSLDVGLYNFSNESWHFALRPEAGLIYEPEPGVGVMFNVKYMNGFKTSKAEASNYFSVNTGIVWTWY
jgi:opacity protein-like surface antigen